MSMTIELPQELEQTVRQHAARRGQDVSDFVVQAVQEKIARASTFDEICAPFAKAVSATGISDEEFDHFFQEVREEVWHEKHAKRP